MLDDRSERIAVVLLVHLQEVCRPPLADAVDPTVGVDRASLGAVGLDFKHHNDSAADGDEEWATIGRHRLNEVTRGERGSIIR